MPSGTSRRAGNERVCEPKQASAVNGPMFSRPGASTGRLGQGTVAAAGFARMGAAAYTEQVARLAAELAVPVGLDPLRLLTRAERRHVIPAIPVRLDRALEDIHEHPGVKQRLLDLAIRAGLRAHPEVVRGDEGDRVGGEDVAAGAGRAGRGRRRRGRRRRRRRAAGRRAR